MAAYRTSRTMSSCNINFYVLMCENLIVFVTKNVSLFIGRFFFLSFNWRDISIKHDFPCIVLTPNSISNIDEIHVQRFRLFYLFVFPFIAYMGVHIVYLLTVPSAQAAPPECLGQKRDQTSLRRHTWRQRSDSHSCPSLLSPTRCTRPHSGHSCSPQTRESRAPEPYRSCETFYKIAPEDVNTQKHDKCYNTANWKCVTHVWVKT